MDLMMRIVMMKKVADVDLDDASLCDSADDLPWNVYDFGEFNPTFDSVFDKNVDLPFSSFIFSYTDTIDHPLISFPKLSSRPRRQPVRFVDEYVSFCLHFFSCY